MKNILDSIKKLYYFWLIVLFVVISYIFPYIMDYYVLRPDESFLPFYEFHIVGNISVLLIASLIIFFIMIVLWLFSARAYVSTTVTVLLLDVLSYASCIKYSARSEMMNYQDLMITEATDIAGEYIRWDFTGYAAFLIVCSVFVIALSVLLEWFCHEYNGFRKIQIVGRIVCAAVSAIIFLFADNMLVNKTDATASVSASFKGQNYSCVLYSFLKTDNNTDMSVTEALDYLTENSDVYKTDGTDTPNVIVIMNESWWDISPLMDINITCSEDPMRIYNELFTRCSSGHVATNVYGGGTISSETEFLMGINTVYRSSSVGISRELENRTEIPGVVSYFNELGYDTVAIHPYEASFFCRNSIYAAYGFDKMIFADEMDYTEKYDAYISDDALADQIIKEYESADDPKFIWSVSIAAHAPGLDKSTELQDYDYPIKVDCTGTSLDESEQRELTRTINSFYLACKAYEKLVEYFEKQDEPTVIVMFGDHCPGITAELEKLLGYNLVTDNFDETRDVYTTPVLMWKNYDTEDNTQVNFAGENINYLVPALIDYAGLPDCDMADVIRYTRTQFTSVSAKMIIDTDGTELTEFSSQQKKTYLSFGTLVNDMISGDTDYAGMWVPQTSK